MIVLPDTKFSIQSHINDYLNYNEIQIKFAEKFFKAVNSARLMRNPRVLIYFIINSLITTAT